MNLFTKDGTLHKEVWVATKDRVWHSDNLPHFHFDLFKDGVYQYLAPFQPLSAAELFIGSTPLVFKK